MSKPSPPVGDRRRHEQDEQRAHPVIAEALPHLGEEQRRQPARMPEERAVVRRSACHAAIGWPRSMTGSCHMQCYEHHVHVSRLAADRLRTARLSASHRCTSPSTRVAASTPSRASVTPDVDLPDRGPRLSGRAGGGRRLAVARRCTTGDDFLVAGRSLPAHVLVFTLLSTWIGSGSLFAGAGLGYRVGFPALWQSAGAWVGIALIFFIAPRVRRLAQYTVPDILELRYGPAARVLGTIDHRPRLHRDRRLPVPRRRPAAEPRRRHRSGDRRAHHRGVLRRSSPRSPGCGRSR